MAKATTNATRQKLLDEAARKHEEAQAALKAAQDKFAAATNEEDRPTAQAEINAAARDVERYAAALKSLSGEKDKASDEKRTFFCRQAIRHDGEDYAEGDEIELTRAECEALPAGAVVG